MAEVISIKVSIRCTHKTSSAVGERRKNEAKGLRRSHEGWQDSVDPGVQGVITMPSAAGSWVERLRISIRFSQQGL